jgi:hypothetical protein
MYTGTQCVYYQLSDADQDCAHSLVTDAQYLFAIAHNDQIYVLGISPLANVILDTVCIIDIKKASLWPPK